MKNRIIFDDQCPMCRAQVRWLKRLDWLQTLEFWPASSEASLRLAPGLTPTQLTTAIHCITPRGEVFTGARAFRTAILRIPLLSFLAVLLWIPGIIHAAELMYRMIARNRYIISKVFACDGACELKPATNPIITSKHGNPT